jgi:hypothetical protein
MCFKLSLRATAFGALALSPFLPQLAHAQTAAPAPPAPPAASAAAPAAPAPAAPATAAPATVTLLAPGMNDVLAFPTNPYSLDVGPLGKWYVDGALTGLGLVQSNRASGDRSAVADLSNGQVFLQKVDGWWQFFVQAGDYSIPVLGAPYTPNDGSHATKNYYDPVPQAFLKLVPMDNLFIQFGKLPTLIGAESTFTFENFNIERGLLWNEEPAVSRGVQVGYTLGPVAFNVSLNDGYYSNRYNWLSGSAAWTINPTNTLTFAAGGNLGHTEYQETPYATPLAQNNSSIYNVIYTYNSAPWVITPYFQAQDIKKDVNLGFDKGASSYAAALLVSYAFDSHFSLAGRGEFIVTNGSEADGAANILYGPGSKAYSLTITPTYQFNRFFVRADGSWVGATSITPGDGLGTSGTAKNQERLVLETGVLF